MYSASQSQLYSQYLRVVWHPTIKPESKFFSILYDTEKPEKLLPDIFEYPSETKESYKMHLHVADWRYLRTDAQKHPLGIVCGVRQVRNNLDDIRSSIVNTRYDVITQNHGMDLFAKNIDERLNKVIFGNIPTVQEVLRKCTKEFGVRVETFDRALHEAGYGTYTLEDAETVLDSLVLAGGVEYVGRGLYSFDTI